MQFRDGSADETVVTTSASSSGSGATSPGITSAGAPTDLAMRARAAMNHAAILEPGTILGERYEILEMLGLGGMGAVYKAHDRQIDRVIALKVIRPDLANNPELLARFKQELLLAREITHKNVIRIFDLHESEGIKFITMEFVAGRDLHRLLVERGKLPVTEAIEIIRQVCSALDAVHAEGIVHRDLKPSNIMREANGRIVLMDFGLARTVAGDGMTQSGAMLGTMEYMSPEQALAEPLDARSDLFAVGLILYELLTGATPYKAESAIASLLMRSRESAPPLSQHDPTLPLSLASVVARCLERERDKRYHSATELMDALDVVLGKKPVSVPSAPAVAAPRRQWIWITAVAVLVLAGAGTAATFWLRSRGAPAVQKPVTVLVGDFQNYTGDPIFSDTLEPMMNIALEGASFVNAFNRSTARNLAQKLPHPTSTLDEQTARLIAISQGLGDVVTGTLNRRGNGYELSVEVVDATTGNMIANSSVTAATKDDLLLAIPKLAVPIRKALGDTTPASDQVDASRGPFTASSLEVVHLYGEGMEQQGSNLQGALQAFTQAVQLDPDFSRAYAGLASVEGNLGQTQAAEKDIKLALQHVDRMTERERYRVRGLYYARTGDWQDCIEENSELVKHFPSDDIGHNNLAYCYRSGRNYQKAIDELKQVLAILPKNQLARTNLALFAAYAGDSHTSQVEARQLLSVNPTSEFGYVALAYSEVEGNQIPQAIATYQQLEKMSAFGQSMAIPGLADIAVYEGRYKDAAQLFESGATADLKAGRLDSAAADFTGLADVRLRQGQKRDALQALQQALANSKSPSVLFRAGRIYAASGDVARARQLGGQLASDPQPESQVFAKLIEGDALLQEGNARKAVEIFTAANSQLDTWLGHFDLGRADLQAGLLVQADSEFDKCLDRSGETLDLFDYVPTYGYMPDMYYYQGKVRQGLDSPGYADSYVKYLSIRGAASEDPLLAEVRRGAAKQDRK